MLELVNLSNHPPDLEIIQNDAKVLKSFLEAHNLDGLEMLLHNPWDSSLHPQSTIKGVHLHYWPNWLDFWLNDKEALFAEFGSAEAIKAAFGGMKRENMLAIYENNIKAAVNSGASYLVFHVSQARASEIFSRKFHYDSKKVIKETIFLVNHLTPFIPSNVMLLFENLWWPGLTLLDRELVEELLKGVNHQAAGIMLDTGHLMNTAQTLKTQEEGIDYILQTVENLGIYKSYIYGIHLHYSLSGKYARKVSSLIKKPPKGISEIIRYVSTIDRHLPFTSPEAGKIADVIRPKFLVHEFIFDSFASWSEKVSKQRQALGYK